MAKGTKYSQQFKEDAVQYRIDHSELSLYNTIRIHSHCGYLSPNEYEEEYLKNLRENAAEIAG